MHPKKMIRFMAVGLVVLSGMAACGGEEKAAVGKERPAVLVTIVEASAQDVNVSEFSVGRIESKADPFVAAEIDGRVVEVLVEVGGEVTEGSSLATIDPGDYQLATDSASAEIGRLGAMIEQQQRLVNRYEALREDKFFSENALDEAHSQLRVLNKQLLAAEARRNQANRDLARTVVKAPIAGKIEQRLISPGDYVRKGSPMFRLNTDDVLRVVLPFPESLSGQLAIGQTVLLESPVKPGHKVEAPISEIRPTVGTVNRSLEAIIDVQNPGGWRAGASVNSELILAVNHHAVVVPEISVVLRPKGQVLYVYQENGTVEERVIQGGVQRDGFIEVLSGLRAGEKVVTDGAAFLTDQAPIRLPQTEK